MRRCSPCALVGPTSEEQTTNDASRRPDPGVGAAAREGGARAGIARVHRGAPSRDAVRLAAGPFSHVRTPNFSRLISRCGVQDCIEIRKGPYEPHEAKVILADFEAGKESLTDALHRFMHAGQIVTIENLTGPLAYRNGRTGLMVHDLPDEMGRFMVELNDFDKFGEQIVQKWIRLPAINIRAFATGSHARACMGVRSPGYARALLGVHRPAGGHGPPALWQLQGREGRRSGRAQDQAEEEADEEAARCGGCARPQRPCQRVTIRLCSYYICQ